VEHVEAVIAFMRAAVERRRRFGDHETQAREWSSLWKYDGDPWDRWDQRYAEERAYLDRIAASSNTDSGDEAAPPPIDLYQEALKRETD